jgi:hypothetical protein
MKIQGHFNPRGIFLILLAAVIFSGCKSAGSKQGVADAESQTVAARQVIVVPVLILSSPGDGSPGNRREPTPESDPRDQSTQAWKSDRTGVPAKL